MLYRTFVMIVCIMLVCPLAIARVITRSVPMKCQVSFLDQNIEKNKEEIVFEDIEAGIYPIKFSSGADILKADIEVKDNDTLLINCSFRQMQVMVSPGLTIGKDGGFMVKIPAGEFQMGSDMGEPDERPIHTVNTDAFYIDVFEVTNSQYAKFMKDTGYNAPRYWEDPKFNGPDHPVVGVTRNDAQTYCKWAGKRLPTEAEWEKAARGGLEGKSYPWGDEQGVVAMEEQAGHENEHSVRTYPVGSVQPNKYGLYDMDGNAWEWCLDWYGEEYYAGSVKDNPKGPESGENRVLRGGSWSAGVYYPLRVAYRYSLKPDKTSNLIGFRCVMQDSDIEQSP